MLSIGYAVSAGFSSQSQRGQLLPSDRVNCLPYLHLQRCIIDQQRVWPVCRCLLLAKSIAHYKHTRTLVLYYTNMMIQQKICTVKQTESTYEDNTAGHSLHSIPLHSYPHLHRSRESQRRKRHAWLGRFYLRCRCANLEIRARTFPSRCIRWKQIMRSHHTRSTIGVSS